MAVAEISAEQPNPASGDSQVKRWIFFSNKWAFYTRPVVIISALFTGACWKAKRSRGNSENPAERLWDVQEGPGRDGETTEFFSPSAGISQHSSVATLAKAERSFPLLPQEGILQRLQSSVEQEESRWRVKLELSQGELKEVCVWGVVVFYLTILSKGVTASSFFIYLKTQMSQKVVSLEQEIERLSDGAELENVSIFFFSIYLFTCTTSQRLGHNWFLSLKLLTLLIDTEDIFFNIWAYICINAGMKNMLNVLLKGSYSEEIKYKVFELFYT